MKERPILFSAPMVRAILDGSKTQTRRVVKPMPDADEHLRPLALKHGGTYMWIAKPVDETIARERSRALTCPYGEPGDLLWVRETWSTHISFDRYAPSELTHIRSFHYWSDGDATTGKKRASIHMPRWASRITLEITAVRVERLQDITQRDAIAEGAPPSHPSIDAVSAEFGHKDFSRSWYAQLWDSINGDSAWDKNPWVWVVEFKRVTNRKDA